MDENARPISEVFPARPPLFSLVMRPSMIAPRNSSGATTRQLNLSPFLLFAVLIGERSCSLKAAFDGTLRSFCIQAETRSSDGTNIAHATNTDAIDPTIAD